MPPDVSPPPEQARDQRRQKLFARWSQGGRLSKAEEAEVEDLIKAARAEAPGLKLESEPATPLGTYRQTYPWYAANLTFWPETTSAESRIRTIKRWVRAGRERSPQDFPPLDNPTQLGAWLRRVSRRDLRKWDAIFSLAQPPAVPGKVPAENSAPSSPPPKAPASLAAPLESIDLKAIEGLSIHDNLEAQRRVVAMAYSLYAKALLTCDPTAQQRQRSYIDASEELRKTEAATEAMRKKNGELVEAGELRAELLRVHSAMATTLDVALSDETVPPDRRARIIARFFGPLREGQYGIADTLPHALITSATLPPPAPLATAA